jgi:hypothetical protein
VPGEVDALTDQLDLLAEAPTERRYTCCGMPCRPVDAPRGTPGYPHADDCPDPNIGTFFDRGGRGPIRRLRCVTFGEPCPHGGTYRGNLVDPFNGVCCNELPPPTQPERSTTTNASDQ